MWNAGYKLTTNFTDANCQEQSNKIFIKNK